MLQAILAILIWAALFLLSGSILGYGFILEHWAIGIGIWLAIMGLTFPSLLVLVPDVTGLALFNILKKKEATRKKEGGEAPEKFERWETTVGLRGIGPGLHFKFPWEQAKEKNFFSLELVTRHHKETYAAKDGPMMIVNWSYQYYPSLRRIEVFATVDDTTIDEGFTDMVSSILSEVIGGMPAEQARADIRKIEQDVLKKFKEERIEARGVGTVSAKDWLEMLYGINFKLIALADIDFSEDYQLARSGKARMDAVIEAAKKIEVGSNGQPTREAVKMVLAEQGKARLNIVDVWGNNDATLRAAATLGSLLGGKDA